MPVRTLAGPAAKKRNRMVCYDSVIADFRTPGTAKNIEATDFFDGSIILFIDCLQKRMHNKTVLNMIRNGQLRELKDLVCDPVINTFEKLDELETPFYDFLKKQYEDERIPFYWKRFIHELYEDITNCAKDPSHLQTRSVDSVDELTAALASLSSLSLPRPTTHSLVYSSKHGQIYARNPNKGGKSKRVKRTKRTKTCKNRVHKRRN